MIFVTLGTQDKPFLRLMQAVEKQIQEGNIQEEVIAQTGSTKYESKIMQIIPYMEQSVFDQYMKEANIVITHGGVGTIIQGLQMKKKMIVAPRLAKYGEHVNDHQLQIATNFAKENYILLLSNFEELNLVLAKAKNFIPKAYKENNQNFISQLEAEIQAQLLLKN